jgi:aconitate hydratase
LLGVKAVIAESFERIHRSNLVGFGVLPLQFKDGDSAKSLGLTGREYFSIRGIDAALKPGVALTVEARDDNNSLRSFEVHCRIDTVTELHYYKNGGILHYVLRELLQSGAH